MEQGLPAGICRAGRQLQRRYGEVSPYPQALRATEIGEKLKKKYGLEFYFSSPTLPKDSCPRWHERNRAVRCADCGIVILPTGSPDIYRAFRPLLPAGRLRASLEKLKKRVSGKRKREEERGWLTLRGRFVFD